MEMVLRGALASVLGGAIGWNRELRNKAAGLRTMMLVALGSAGAMMAVVEVVALAGANEEIQLDPLRVISGIIGGIGFLGAGSIIQSRGSVRGLTTAATIWAAACIGIACGLGIYRLALVLTGFVLVTLIAVTALKGDILPDKNGGDDDTD